MTFNEFLVNTAAYALVIKILLLSGGLAEPRRLLHRADAL